MLVAPSNRSSGGKAWIKDVASDGKAIVEYIVPKKISKDVAPSRIALSTLDNVARSQSQDESALPSLLSVNYGAARAFRNASVNVQTKKVKRSSRKTTDELLRMPIVDAYAYLAKQTQVGWLRNVESGIVPTESGRKPQLTTEEKNKIMSLRRYMAGVDLPKPTSVLAFAWNVDVMRLRVVV